MNKRQLVKFFKDLSYKDIKFEIVEYHVGCEFSLIGSRELTDPVSGKREWLYAEETFKYSCSEIELLSAIRDWIHQVECHEADEWLIYKGEQPFHPHKAKVSVL